MKLKTLREKARILTCAIVLLLLISMAAASAPTAAAAGLAIPRDQTVVVSNDWGPAYPWNPLTSQSTAWGMDMMYPILYMYCPYTSEWIPYLAKSYEWVDKYTLKVKIRDEAKWDDGQAITADDVKYSLELGKKYSVAQYTPLWTYIQSIQVVDSKTVAFYANQSSLNYFQMLTILWSTLILPKHRWEAIEAQYNYSSKITTDFLDDDPIQIVGGGPYKLIYSDVNGFYYERVDDWWGKDTFGLPNPKYIFHRSYTDNNAFAIAYEAGECDLGTHMLSAIWDLWQKKGLARGTYYSASPYFVGGASVNLYMNYLKHGLDNVDVRRAIAYALPIADMISGPYNNYSIPAVPVPIIHTTSAATFINQSLVDQYGWEYNITKANKILDDAGITKGDDGIRKLSDGTRLSFTIQVPSGWTDWMAICDLISTSLGKIGIQLNEEFPDFMGVWWPRLTNKEIDMCLGWSGESPGFDHPWNSFRTMMDARLSFPAGDWDNYNNTVPEALIDSIPTETDVNVLKSTYSKLEEIWLKDVVAVPLFYGAIWYEYSEDYWVGWPTKDNGYWFTNFYGGTPSGNPAAFPSALPTFFTIVPKGQTPVQPSWVTSTKLSTDKIYTDLAAIPEYPSFLILPLLMALTLLAALVYRRKK
jgi:peptide/nickel transport system substrate-binding protein